MKIALLYILPLLVASSLTAFAKNPPRTPAETLRARPVRYAVTIVHTRTLNYPRPGEFRSFGIVEVAPNAYSLGSELPPIAEFDPGAESAPAGSLAVDRVYVAPEVRAPFVRTIIRNDGTVAEGSYRLTPLGPQGTNRAVINQITGLPVDR
jgi:hypothetical protein